MTDQTSILLDDLTFPEGPRWHDGRLWFSDFYAHEVVAVDLEGNRETIVKVPGQPSGLGWTPDGRLLVVSTLRREVVVVQSLALVIMLMILGMNFLMDIAYGFLDPRIRDKQEAQRLA